jgi:hypothetical protein
MMNPMNKKAPGAKGIPQPFKRQAGHAPHTKSAVAQLKTGVSVQGIKQPVAPPVYRPQATPPSAVQPKMASGVVNRNPPVAPAVYRPQTTPKVLQTKLAPQQQTRTGQPPRQPVAPPVYRPRPNKIVQPKMANAGAKPRPSAAPPVYRPQPTQKVLQTKRATTPQANSLQAPKAARAVQAAQRPTLAVAPTAPAAATPARASVVQRVRSTFQPRLPPGKHVKLTVDDAISQDKVNQFVDSLKRSEMDWYESDNPREDTKQQVLYNSNWPRAVQQDPFGRGVYEVWQCPNCRQPTTYAGIDLGHITNWKPYLKQAGVTNKTEALAAYNDLNNLRLECGTCNRGHAFEQDDRGHYNDVPLKGDFPKNKEGQKQFEEITESYKGVDLDNYDMSDSFIDDSEEEPLTLINISPVTLTDSLGGIHSGTSETFKGAQLRLTGKKYNQWREVEVVESFDPRLPEKILVWANKKHLKKVGTYQRY